MAKQNATNQIIPATSSTAPVSPVVEHEALVEESLATEDLDVAGEETLDGNTPVIIPVPSVGRMVHYVAWEPMEGDSRLHAVHHAAIVTKVHSGGSPDSPLSLFVMAPGGTASVTGAVHDEAFGAGTWHWPEFVPGVEVVAGEA